MYITWYGQSSFKIESKNISVLLDPYSAKNVGLRGPNLKSDIIIFSKKEKRKKIFDEGIFLIDGPGEYETKNVFVYGFSVEEDKTIYLIEIEQVKIGYLGEINKLLKLEMIEKLDDIDLLIIPVGNRKLFLSAKNSMKIIKEIEPAIIIPSCYQLPDLKIRLDPLKSFLQEVGIKKIVPVNKLRLKKSDITEQKMSIVVLNKK
ncbi:MBL fold metallo-hydrolase [bacterium]|nr:MBL fold metallo-hydrolase [bacterium]